MAKALEDLFRGMECTILGDPETPVSGLAFRSDAVAPGDLFSCIVGTTVDGHMFAQDAVDRGAAALVVERPLSLERADKVAQAVVADSRKGMAWSAAKFYDDPSQAFQLVGITGTNGKTTVTYLVDHIAESCGKATGLIGTTGNKVGGVEERAIHTTPESPDLQHLLARMRDAGAEVVAMEASSHAIDLRRIWGCTFSVTAFTNLTQDHLDYHRTLENYFEAKAKLFTSDYPAKRVIGVDDEWGRELCRRCREAGDDVLTTGFAQDADIHPVEVAYGTAETEVELMVRGEAFHVRYPLVGRFNVENVMTALGIGIQLGFAVEDVVHALRDVPTPPGRLERVRTEHDGGISIYVDYAHTPDAIKNAVSSVLALEEEAEGEDGRTIVVFGCGGDRDRGKRPLMGQAALAADYAILTTDNPRHEDPDVIIADTVAGMGEPDGRYEVVPDRRLAIRRAIEVARPGDCILLAGKGHEDYQLVGDEVLHFDDREVAAEELERAFGGAAAGEAADGTGA